MWVSVSSWNKGKASNLALFLCTLTFTDHREEYYTLGESTTEMTESEMLTNITPVSGVYIAHDIRYISNTLDFTGTTRHDEDTEYAAYYSASVQEEVAAELGDGFEGPYIFATLPQSAGQGGPGGGTPPSGGPGGGERPTAPAAENSEIAAFPAMTHSATEAYNNPVLHITEAGTYRLKGTWHGQIWVEAGEDEDDKVALILDGVTVSCDVAPALVFKEVYECGPSDEDTASASWRTLGSSLVENAGAVVVLADGSTNTFTGSNLYRMLKPEKKKASVTAIDGTDVSQQKKRYKMDGAFYSAVSMVIGAESSNGGGKLNITSTTYEGIETAMHLTIDSGTVSVTAVDDGINVNEDDISVFTLDGGSLAISSNNGDGIDSNGWAVVNGGTLNITAGSQKSASSGEAGIDAEKDTYIYDETAYTWSQAGSGTTTQPGTDGQSGGETETDNTTTAVNPIEITDDSGIVIMAIRYTNPAIDTDNTSREIEESGKIFTLNHTVNSFSGVK